MRTSKILFKTVYLLEISRAPLIWFFAYLVLCLFGSLSPKRTSYFIAALICLFLPQSAFAQGASLSIYPPVIEVQTLPPSSPLVPITIQNNNENDVALKIALIPFKQKGLNGDTELNPEAIDQGFYKYFKDRIQFLVDGKKTDAITLAPLETKEVDLNINLQKGDPPGDYYYSIVFLTDSNSLNDTSSSLLPAGIATNLLLSIGPKGKTAGGISEFTTSFFKKSGPVGFKLKVHNASAHLVLPTGKLIIKNMLNQTVGEVNILPQYLLAGADRYLVDSLQAPSAALKSEINNQKSIISNQYSINPVVVWPETFLLGWYSVTAQIQLEENGSMISANTYFFAFPLYFFFAIVIIIFVIASIYLRVKKKL
jgi:hypothetical protein